jgi:arsenate reductase
MDKKRVLFICVHNSARSQMAEAYLNTLAGDEYQAESAGLEPTTINPLVVEAMREEGIDLSGKGTQSVFALFREGRLFDHVVTVCDDASEKQCPIFPGVVVRGHWPFPDPAEVEGTREEKLVQVREIRDSIKAGIQGFILDNLK